MPKRHFDVAVVGAGPGGSLLAKCLAEKKLSVALIDSLADSLAVAPAPRGPRIGESLPAAAGALLESVGLGALLAHDSGHLKSFGTCSAWGRAELHEHDFIRDPRGYGWHLDRAKFDRDLFGASVAAGCTILPGVCSGIEWQDHDWRLELAGQDISATWVVDATGRSSAIARKLGSKRQIASELTALWFTLPSATSDLDSRTLIESTADGWWYSARLPGQTRVFALQTSKSRAYDFLSEGALVTKLFQTDHLRKVVPVSAVKKLKRAQISLREAGASRLERIIGAGWLAIGDAAMAFDPLSSQGLFNALCSAVQASDAISGVFAGEVSLLKNYADTMEHVWTICEARRNSYYALETRWETRLLQGA